MDNPDIIDPEEQVADNVEMQQEATEDYLEDTSPTYNKPDDLYSLFWKTIKIDDSSKVANLDKYELGMLNMSVRDCQNIAQLCHMLGYEEVEDWLNRQAQIILRTSASKKGWLTELFVSAKRFSAKEKRMGTPEMINMGGEETTHKKHFWDKWRKK